MKHLISLLLIVLALPLLASPSGIPALIPMPVEVVAADGVCRLPQDATVHVEKSLGAGPVVRILREAGLNPVRGGESGAVISVVRGEVKNPHGFPGAYRMEITPKKVLVTVREDQGVIHAMETLRQLVLKERGGLRVPCLGVCDWPAFPVRGFMLDTGRNYQTPALIREQVDIMSRYKLNVFHFHLTDNPGWRLESKVHPEVTSQMTRQPGKYYTHSEFRDLVKYCRERGIVLVPELDMPGHSASFRKSLGIRSMNDAESRRILKDLLTEMASLASPEDMPYIHLGTDEIRDKAERVDGTFLAEMSAHVRSLGREVIGWRRGLEDPADKKRITQLWARANPLPENPFIDSRSTYLNHMDPFECVSTFLFQQSCRAPHGDSRRLGGIMCSWPDIRIENERDQLAQNPVYPAMLAFSESMWRGVSSDDREKYWANLPPPGSAEFTRFAEFEARMLDHKQRYFQGKEFPYFKQTDMRWRILGPLPHGGDVKREFPVEQKLEDSYTVDGTSYRWLDRKVGAATLYFTHFFGFGGLVAGKEGTCYALTHIWSPEDRRVPVWTGFHHSSRSDRRGAVQFHRGEWHSSQPWVKVNGKAIDPPEWKVLAAKGDEDPFTDEDYFFRKPVDVEFKRGWNRILMKVPKRASDWKWVATFVPVGNTSGFRYSDELEPK